MILIFRAEVDLRLTLSKGSPVAYKSTFGLSSAKKMERARRESATLRYTRAVQHLNDKIKACEDRARALVAEDRIEEAEEVIKEAHILLAARNVVFAEQLEHRLS